MGYWLKSLRNNWVAAVLAVGLLLVFYAARTGGAALGAAVAAAVAAGFSALVTFLLWQVIKDQTVIFREQTETMRPGCRIHPLASGVYGAQDSFLGYFGAPGFRDPKQFTGVVCAVVPKPGCRAAPMAAFVHFLDSNQVVLERIRAIAFSISNREERTAERWLPGMWLPAKVWEEQGEVVCIGLASATFADEVEKLSRKRLSSIRIAIESNYGTDVSESIPLPPLDDLDRMALDADLLDLLREGRCGDHQPSDAVGPDN